MPEKTLTYIQVALGASLLLLLGGCVQTQATMLSGAEYPELEPEEVTIFLSFEEIPAPYEQVALLNAQGSSGMTNEAQMYEAFRKRAAKIGANGVVLGGVNEPGSGAKIAGAIFGVSPERRGEAVAVFVFYDQEFEEAEVGAADSTSSNAP